MRRTWLAGGLMLLFVLPAGKHGLVGGDGSGQTDWRQRLPSLEGKSLDAFLAQTTENGSPDPWEVADELHLAGRAEACKRLAELLPMEADALLAALSASAPRSLGSALAEILRQAEGALAGGDPATALVALDTLSGALPDATIATVRFRTLRAKALVELGQTSASAEEDYVAAELAWRIGWFRRATDCFRESLVSAARAFSHELALRAAEGLLECHRRAGAEADAADTLADAAELAEAIGEFPRALLFVEEAAELYEQLDRRVDAASAQGHAAEVLARLGDARAAQRIEVGIRQALRDAGASVGRQAETLQRLGTVYLLRGDAAAGEGALREALALRLVERAEAVSRGMPQGQVDAIDTAIAGSEGNLGLFYVADGRFDEALSAFDRALRLFDAQQHEYGTATFRLNSADALMRRARARELERTAGEAKGIATVSDEARADCERALALLAQATSSFNDMGDEEGILAAQSTVGQVHSVLGNFSDARQALEPGLAAADRLHLPAPALEASIALARLDLVEGRESVCIERAKDISRRLRATYSGMPDIDLARARSGSTDAFDLGIQAAVAIGRLPDGWDLLEESKSAALLRGLGSRAAAARALVDPEAVRSFESARRTKAVALAAYIAERAKMPLDRDILEQRWRAYQDARASDQAATNRLEGAERAGVERIVPVRMESIEGLRRAMVELGSSRPGGLGPLPVVVEFNLQAQQGYAFVVTRSDMHVVHFKGAGYQAVRRALGLLANSDAPETRADVKTPTVLREEVLQPLREHLIAPLKLPRGPLQVLVCPDRELSFVPFGLLLGKDVETAVEPSATVFTHLVKKRRLKGSATLAVGAADYSKSVDPTALSRRGGPKLAPLRHSRAEVEAVTARPGDYPLLGREATEGALREALATPRTNPWWRSIHFSAHGLIDVEWPNLSCIALTPAAGDDGLLTALELLRLNLQSDLVVLSACQTGRGTFLRGEGLIGLARACMEAGAPRVLVSLWSVDDEATAFLMRRFYERWNAGERTGQALVGAQRDTYEHEVLREVAGADGTQLTEASRPWADPYYWAAWVLWGLPE